MDRTASGRGLQGTETHQGARNTGPPFWQMKIDPAAKWNTIPRQRMNRGAKIAFTLPLVVTAIGCALLWLAPRGPLYKGRRTADWVAQALHEKSRSEAFEAVLQIGAPAVPFIARRGLHDRCHKFHFLSSDHVLGFGMGHPRLDRWLRKAKWVENCVVRHGQADWLLSCMGTNALAAIPYLTKRARMGDLRAAAVAYFIDRRTNLLVETCERLARNDPGELLYGQELFWFRQDHELNQYLVHLLEGLYADPRLASGDQEAVMFELESRSNDATAAIARLLARQTNATVRAR
jgi:hypothetical protein